MRRAGAPTLFQATAARDLPNDDPKPVRPRMHFFTMANKRHGGFLSACGLMSRLREHFHVTGWPLFGEVPRENLADLRSAADRIGDRGSMPEMTGGRHVVMYMNDYPPIFGSHSSHWRRLLPAAASVQIVFNRSLGGLPREHWLADCVTHLFFHDSSMAHSWKTLTRDSPLSTLPAEVLAPPVDLSGFRDLPGGRPAPPPVIVGRLAGDGEVPRNAVDFYRAAAEALPEARFWFMPPPPALEVVFAGDTRFRFLARDALEVPEFLRACHIFALTYWRGVPVPGPRALMEAMAAGCPPVVIDRDGPRDRVEHGVSGFRSNDDSEFINYVVKLARDPALRHRISVGARQRSRGWGPEVWVERIVRNSLGVTP